MDIFGTGKSVLPADFAFALVKNYYKSPRLAKKVAASQAIQNLKCLSRQKLSKLASDRRLFIVQRAARLGKKVTLRFNYPSGFRTRPSINLHPGIGLWPEDHEKVRLFLEMLTVYLVTLKRSGRDLETLLNSLWPFGSFSLVISPVHSLNPKEDLLPKVTPKGVIVAVFCYASNLASHQLQLVYEYSESVDDALVSFNSYMDLASDRSEGRE